MSDTDLVGLYIRITQIAVQEQLPASENLIDKIVHSFADTNGILRDEPNLEEHALERSHLSILRYVDDKFHGIQSK